LEGIVEGTIDEPTRPDDVALTFPIQLQD